MKEQNKIKSVLLGLLVFIVVYLLGAFYSVTLNIDRWGEGTRFFVSFFGGLLAVLTIMGKYDS